MNFSIFFVVVPLLDFKCYTIAYFPTNCKDGQYELKRREEVSNKHNKGNLNLDVKDIISVL